MARPWKVAEWTDLLERLDTTRDWTTSEIFDAAKKGNSNANHNRLVLALREAGWTRRRVMLDGKRIAVWRHPYHG